MTPTAIATDLFHSIAIIGLAYCILRQTRLNTIKSEQTRVQNELNDGNAVLFKMIGERVFPEAPWADLNINDDEGGEG